MSPTPRAPAAGDRNRLRAYHVDWLRILAVLLLVPFHSAMIFVPWGYHVRNAETSVALEAFNRFLGAWQMPLLFVLSGAGTRFALRHRTAKGYLGERVRRLLVPLLFGVLFVVPPQTYFERLQKGEFRGSFLEFYPHIFDGFYPEGNFTWNHLWFLAYLLVFSLLLSPLFLRGRREPIGRPGSSSRAYLTTRKGLLSLALPLMVVEALLRVRWPGFQNLVDDWANFCSYLTLFGYGYLIYSNEKAVASVAEHRWLFLALASLSFLVLTAVELSGARPTWGYNPGCLAFLGLRGLNTWCWVLALLGFGRTWLEGTTSWYRYVVTAGLPFYVLHQTAVIAIGYHVIRWEAGVLLKFGVVTVTSFAATLAAYELLVRRVPALRFASGMRPRGKGAP